MKRQMCNGCGEDLPLSSFTKDAAAKNGRRKICRRCTQEHRGMRENWMPVLCRHCGAEVNDETCVDVCHQCMIKGKKFCKGEWWLCVHDPTGTRQWLGGHIKREEARQTLASGYFPTGIIYEVWRDKEFATLIGVIGRELTPQTTMELDTDGYKPKGDGRFFIP